MTNLPTYTPDPNDPLVGLSEAVSYWRRGAPLTVHDLAADWSWQAAYRDTLNPIRGFRVPGGRVVWEEAEYRSRYDRVLIWRVAPTPTGGVRAYSRFVDPATPVQMVYA